MNAEYSLIFLNDVLKKLKINNKNELWKLFKERLKNFITKNLPLIIRNSKFNELEQDL